MRKSVKAAWPAICEKYEGRLPFMYLDVKHKLTTGTGNLIDTVAEAQELPWFKADGTSATPAEVEAEWRMIKARTDLARTRRAGWAYGDIATLRLKPDTLDRLLFSETERHWSEFVELWPLAEKWSADAQLAALDLVWQNGPAFASVKRLGLYVWPNMRKAFTNHDWTAAAAAVPGTGARADHRRRLFNNAAAAVKLGANPDTLWDTKTPTAPTKPVETNPIMYSNAWRTEYVRFRGGVVAPVQAKVLAAIPSPANMVQGGLSQSVKASANTHAGVGSYDLGVAGWSKAKINALCAELIRSGEIAFPRGGWFGSPMFSTHVHVVSTNVPRSALHPEARAQIDAYKANRNGLANGGRFVGPRPPLGSWASSPYNPDNIKPVPNGGKSQTYYVNVAKGSKMLALNVDRKPKAFTRKRGDKVVAVKLVKRWGRWNAVTRFGTYYALELLSETKPK